LVSFLLHCSASNLVLAILKHDKIRRGKFALAPPLQIIRPRDVRPWPKRLFIVALVYKLEHNFM